MSRERGLLVPPIVLKMGSISHLRGFQYFVGLRFKSHGANTACVERSSVGRKADRTCILGSGNDNSTLYSPQQSGKGIIGSWSPPQHVP